MAVSVRTTSMFVAGAPSLLFDHPFQADAIGHPAYDVSPDGFGMRPSTPIWQPDEPFDVSLN